MVLLLHSLVTLVCGVECVLALRDIRSRLAKLIVFTGFGLIHGVAPALSRVSDLPASFASFSERSRIHAAALALIGIVLFSGGCRLYEAMRCQWTGVSPNLMAVLGEPEGQRLLRGLFWVCAVTAVVAWLILVMATGVSLTEYLRAPRFSLRFSGNIHFRVFARHFLFLANVPGFVCFFLPRRYRAMGVVYALGMAVFLYYADKGSRLAPLGLVGSLMMGYALHRQIAVRRFVLLAFSATFLVYLSVSLYTVRWQMMRSTPSEMVRIIFDRDTYRGALTRDPLFYHQYLVASVELFPHSHPFLNGGTYRRILVFFVPRSYLPEIKPADTTRVFAETVLPGRGTKDAMIPPTLIGDSYINFWGWPGISLMFFHGILFGYVICKMRVSVLWFVGIGAPFVRLALLTIRGQPYQLFVSSLSALVMVWIIGRLIGFSFKRAKAIGQGGLTRYYAERTGLIIPDVAANPLRPQTRETPSGGGARTR